MSDETSQAQPVPHNEPVNFATLGAANLAAIQLLDLVKAGASPSTLESSENGIGYRLSAISSPNDSNIKHLWRIGAGPSQKMPDKDVERAEPDILLCPPGKSYSATLAHKDILAIHATLELHPKSDVLVLKTKSNRHPIIYKKGDIGNRDLEMASLDKNSCVMRRKRNYLRIGEYEFVLELASRGLDGHNEEPKVDSPYYPGLYASPIVSSANMAFPRISWNVWLHHKKLHTAITSGVNIYTGDPVAVKELPPRKALASQVHSRLRIASQYSKDLDKGVLGVLDVWCEHNTSPPCFFDKRREASDTCQKIFYSTPLAKHSFVDMPWNDVEYENRLVFLYQTLSGLVKLHQQRVIHGNIRPDSLLIFDAPESTESTESAGKLNALPGRAVISPAIRHTIRCNKSVCAAPELWETETGADLDKEKIDVWGLAASWLFAFIFVPSGVIMNVDSYSWLDQTISLQTKKGKITEPLAQLLRQMLAWEPKDRPSAAEVLEHEIWQPMRDRKDEEKQNRKQKRKALVEASVTGKKRVRVLSPEVDE
ncbi:kinase-like domain-containing protein [Trichoderma austrokoningii]